jgi:hypothetical protein
VNPSERFLGVETADRVDLPEGMARNNIGLDGDIPRLYQLAAMRMRFVLDCTSDPVARSWSVIASRLRRLYLSFQRRIPHYNWCVFQLFLHRLIIGKLWADSISSPPSATFAHQLNFNASEKAKQPSHGEP